MSSYWVVVGVPLVKSKTSALNWKIFPNPASDELIISIENKLKESNVAILDVTGKLIFNTVEKVNSQLKVNDRYRRGIAGGASSVAAIPS